MKPAAIQEIPFHDSFCLQVMLLKINLDLIYLFLRSSHLFVPDFGVSTTILNRKDIFRRWCKLNFGTLRDQVKSCYFSERIGAWRQYFYFLYKFLGTIGWKRLGQLFTVLIWIYYYLLNRI